MRSLLDASVLIAFLDTEHNFHDKALDWFSANSSRGWATCPIVENAALRILTNPNYSKVKQYNLADVSNMLRYNISATNHEFWRDDISLLDIALFDFSRILGPRQLTDVYLLALATRHNGRLVTFDERIPISAVRKASASNLCVV